MIVSKLSANIVYIVESVQNTLHALVDNCMDGDGGQLDLCV